MSIDDAPQNIRSILRREFLARNAMGVGSIALAWMLAQEQADGKPTAVTARPHNDLLPRVPRVAPQAHAMISLFQHGGPSHMDLTDPKPELTKYSGTEYSGDIQYSFVNQASKKLLGSPFRFAPQGQCGMELSELLPYTSQVADELCLLRGMHTGANGHEVSLRYFHGGIPGVTGRPTLGSWLVYGLGTASQNLPAFMVLTDPAGSPVDGVHNWSNGFMPAMFQGTVLRPTEPRIHNLQPPAHIAGTFQQQNLEFLRRLNQRYLDEHPQEAEIEARIASYELAARMQTAASEALDISRETEATHRMYGLDHDETREYGTRCLIARRLVERGVRFVQLFHQNQPWDTHDQLTKRLPEICRKTDLPVAALVHDLRQRGMLNSTIVHWGGEIGRLPVTQDHGSPEKAGRDHNGQGFSIWLAGGGIRGGMVWGKTDEFGHRAVENVITPNDFQATIFHLFGLEHEQVTFPHNGRSQVMTANRPAHVVHEIIG